MNDSTDRRGFIGLCGRTAMAIAASGAAAGLATTPAFALENAPRARLLDKNGAPLKASALPMHANWIFHYPYHSSPALLIRLDKAAEPTRVKDREGNGYEWPGGVGPGNSIVAYAAICAHAMTYNSKETAFINYRKEAAELTGIGRAITCCAHGSVYEPAGGATVKAGPAKFPLAGIVLEHDPTSDGVYATGVVGTALYGEFLKTYRKELRQQFGRSKYKKFVDGQTVAMPVREYAIDAIQC